MKANVENLIDLMFDNKRQYQIPVYQRNYDWSKDNCLELFNDVVDAYKREDKHFLGTIVQVQLGEEDGINKYLIIDGQQRTTTIYLLLKALYDSTNQSDDLHEELENLLFNKKSNRILTNEDKTKLKLKPIKSDNEEFIKLMSDETSKIDTSSNIWINYEYFKQLIARESKVEISPKNILKGIKYLQIVMITLTEPEDNPQVIFERINSTGEDLTLADLIRNYLLMTDQNREFLFENYWVPLEGLFKENRRENLQSFFESYLLYKIPDYNGKDSYHQFKKYCDKQKISHKELVEEMLIFAYYYHFFLYPKNVEIFKNSILGDFKVDQATTNLLCGYISLKQTTIFPFLFSVFEDYRNKTITLKELDDTLSFFLNYTIRRNICGVPTNSLRGLYKGLYKRIFPTQQNKENYLDSIYKCMATIQTKDSVPGDTKVMDALITANLYKNKGACKLLLSIIENGLSSYKEGVNIDEQITIEHVMPQNEDNTWWKNELGENYDFVYSKYRHTIGNLTLTGFNSELSDKSFPDKKEILKTTKFTVLDADIVNKEHWNQQCIEERAGLLGKKLLNELKLPAIFDKTPMKNEGSRHFINDNYDYTGFTPVNFTLLGENRNVESAKDFLIKVLVILYDLDKYKLSSLASENYKNEKAQKPMISYDPRVLRAPGEIGNSGIYVETNRSTNDLIRLTKFFLDLYEVNNDDFVFTIRPTKVDA